MAKKKYSLRELADLLTAKYSGDPNCIVTGIGTLEDATATQISFVSESRYLKYLPQTLAAIVIIRPEDVKWCPAPKNLLIVADPYLAYAKISALFVTEPQALPGVHATAIVGEDCKIGDSVSIGPYCVIGNRVELGDGVKVGAGCVVADDVVVGANSTLYPRVVLYHEVKIGKNALVHSGVVIGADGFGNANAAGEWHKIYQLGKVVIGDNVEIGANTTIDRGAIADTIIEDGVKLDNQIQIGHNVKIGAHSAIAGCVGIAGSTKIGRHCLIGGCVGINGHIDITDRVIITGKSAIAKSIDKPGIYSSGIPALPHRVWGRILARLGQLEEIIKRIRTVEKKQV